MDNALCYAAIQSGNLHVAKLVYHQHKSKKQINALQHKSKINAWELPSAN